MAWPKSRKRIQKMDSSNSLEQQHNTFPLSSITHKRDWIQKQKTIGMMHSEAHLGSDIKSLYLGSEEQLNPNNKKKTSFDLETK